MSDKVLEESKCSFEVALAWCTNAKNSLQNVHGFSPFQLALGQNPKLSSMINDKPPAYTPQSSIKILMDNLNAIHKAQEAFIMSENSERISRALSHNIRTNNDTKFLLVMLSTTKELTIGDGVDQEKSYSLTKPKK